jgi:hypothetical protein
VFLAETTGDDAVAKTYKYQWLVEVQPSPLTQQATTDFVKADLVEIDHGVLSFWSCDADNFKTYPLCAFAPGQWQKCEVTEAIMGCGNGMFPATQEGREAYERR